MVISAAGRRRRCTGSETRNSMDTNLIYEAEIPFVNCLVLLNIIVFLRCSIDSIVLQGSVTCFTIFCIHVVVETNTVSLNKKTKIPR